MFFAARFFAARFFAIALAGNIYLQFVKKIAISFSYARSYYRKDKWKMAQQPWRDNRGTPEYNNANGYVTHKLNTYDKHGRQLFHHTWFNTQTNRRISYDTYDAGMFVGHVYVEGSGHEVNNLTGQVVDRWDGTTSYNRYDAYGNVKEVVYPR